VLVRKLFADKPDRTVIIVNGNFNYVFKVEPTAGGSSSSAGVRGVTVSSCKRKHFDHTEEPALQIPSNLLLMDASSRKVALVEGPCMSAIIFVASMDPGHFKNVKQSKPSYEELYFPIWTAEEVITAHEYLCDSNLTSLGLLETRLLTAGPFPRYVADEKQFYRRCTDLETAVGDEQLIAGFSLSSDKAVGADGKLPSTVYTVGPAQNEDGTFDFFTAVVSFASPMAKSKVTHGRWKTLFNAMSDAPPQAKSMLGQWFEPIAIKAIQRLLNVNENNVHYFSPADARPADVPATNAFEAAVRSAVKSHLYVPPANYGVIDLMKDTKTAYQVTLSLKHPSKQTAVDALVAKFCGSTRGYKLTIHYVVPYSNSTFTLPGYTSSHVEVVLYQLPAADDKLWKEINISEFY
jgi:hypothetical protein